MIHHCCSHDVLVYVHQVLVCMSCVCVRPVREVKDVQKGVRHHIMCLTSPPLMSTKQKPEKEDNEHKFPTYQELAPECML